MLFGGKGIVGLDIGSSHLKAVTLKEKRGGYDLDSFEMLQLPPDLIVEGSIIDSLRLTEAIKELIKKGGIKARQASIGIAGHASVIIRRILVSEMSEEELHESIKFEAEQYVPFDIEDVAIDFQILGPSEEPGQMDVMLVAVKRDVINEYTAVVSEAGLTPVVVDASAFALSNMYEVNYEIEPGTTVALVNVGASTLNLNILKGGVSVFTRDSAVGSMLHTEALRKEFDLSFEDAERLKRGVKLENVTPEKAEAALRSASGEIASEVLRSIDYFRSTAYHEDINEIVLSGGGALVRGFPNIVADTAGLEVKIAEPFKNIGIPNRYVGLVEDVQCLAAVAVGLALRRPGDR